MRGLRYAVHHWGDPGAPDLFLLHGWLDVAATFAPVVERLLPQFHVIAPDWRGFGQTEWPQDGYFFMDYVGDLDAILTHYSPDRAVRLAGHSMGAQVAAHYAGLRPGRVARLACLDSLLLPDTTAEELLQRQRQWLGQIRETPPNKVFPSYRELARRVARLYAGISDEQALFIAHCWGVELPSGSVTFSYDPKHRRIFSVPYRLADSMTVWREVTAPTLFLDGGRSPFHERLSVADRAGRRACFRQHQERTIAHAGHMLHFDAPAETAAALAEFFKA